MVENNLLKKGAEAVRIITTKIITKHCCYHGAIREWLKWWWQICVCSTEIKNLKSWLWFCWLWDLVIFCKQVSGYLWGDHCPIFLLSSKKELLYFFFFQNRFSYVHLFMTILYSNYFTSTAYYKFDFFLLTFETHSLQYYMYINIKEFTLFFCYKILKKLQFCPNWFCFLSF